VYLNIISFSRSSICFYFWQMFQAVVSCFRFKQTTEFHRYRRLFPFLERSLIKLVRHTLEIKSGIINEPYLLIFHLIGLFGYYFARIAMGNREAELSLHLFKKYRSRYFLAKFCMPSPTLSSGYSIYNNSTQFYPGRFDPIRARG